MTEPEITNCIVNYLRGLGWTIHAVDMPQMGGGVLLRPNGSRQKNKGSLIPDLIASRGAKLLIVESKSYFEPKDIEKLVLLASPEYSASLSELMTKTSTTELITAIAGPATDSLVSRRAEITSLVDHFFEVSQDGTVYQSAK